MIKDLARELIPPALLRVARQLRKVPQPEAGPRVGFFGDYRTYDEALADCGEGYQSDAILDITMRNTAKIRESDRADIHPHIAPFLSSFFLAAADIGHTIKVIDYGGAMGAHYFHVRRLLPKKYRLQWLVVDLPRTASLATEAFGNEELSFADRLDEEASADVVVASCVFQVLSRPYETIERLLSVDASHFIFPLIPLTNDGEDRLTVEYVSPTVATMSVPHWFFSRRKIEEILSSERQMSTWRHAEYTNPVDGAPCEYFGFHLKRP
ncbi:methyltransferase, TIGR04325 family [Rhizobium sp. 9T]|uniref:Methyltransferase, TIGR04325 family n=1 Tax=Rhizobium croatiense TaxID=2867516 RepID=A0ABS7LXK1_9HYPH|nr:methyltransferase, TIGR04325 family [Rhizobium croatiense]MBY4606174.1 methyltransferase, TIGR04325 family [Rhizobium croatiense]MBY4629574.1 methyltransferase, TIGR04325 family [Rhizobium croatiense]